MALITTKRLIIRPFSPQDGEDLFEYLSQEEVVKYEPYGVFSKEEAYKEAERRSKDESFLAVQQKNGRVIGNLYFAESGYQTRELGYVFNYHFWKQGYARESITGLLIAAFQLMEVRRVVAQCNPLNENSWHLLERLGFRREGHLLQNVSFKQDSAGNPIWQDTYIYALLKSEWK